MAAWTSWAAASMSRVRVNWSVICVLPRALEDSMESMPGDGGELAFQGRGHGGGHGLGAGPGQRRGDLDRGIVHVRQIAHRELAEGRNAEQQDRHHDQGRHDRAGG